MVGFANERALLAALANNFALAGRTRSDAGPGVPGASGVGGANGGVPSLGGGGSIPGTATTGAGVANALAASGGTLAPTDPVSQQVASVIGFNRNNNEPSDPGDFGNLDRDINPAGQLSPTLDPATAMLAMAQGFAAGGPLGAMIGLAEAAAGAPQSFVTQPATGTQLMNQLNNGGLPFNEPSDQGDRGGGAPDLGKTDPQTGRASGPV